MYAQQGQTSLTEERDKRRDTYQANKYEGTTARPLPLAMYQYPGLSGIFMFAVLYETTNCLWLFSYMVRVSLDATANQQ